MNVVHTSRLGHPGSRYMDPNVMVTVPFNANNPADPEAAEKKVAPTHCWLPLTFDLGRRRILRLLGLRLWAVHSWTSTFAIRWGGHHHPIYILGRY